MALEKSFKLNPKFYSPYKIIQNIGMVAYKLEIPVKATIHHVFHVSLLKKKVGDNALVSFTFQW